MVGIMVGSGAGRARASVQARLGGHPRPAPPLRADSVRGFEPQGIPARAGPRPAVPLSSRAVPAAANPTRVALAAVAALTGFAANSLLCRRALGTSAIDAWSFTAVRIGSGALTLLVLARLGSGRDIG